MTDDAGQSFSTLSYHKFQRKKPLNGIFTRNAAIALEPV